MRFSFSSNAFARTSLKNAIKAIAAAGYDGLVTVEFYNHDTDPARAAAQALSFLKGRYEVLDAV